MPLITCHSTLITTQVLFRHQICRFLYLLADIIVNDATLQYIEHISAVIHSSFKETPFEICYFIQRNITQ